jgi:hypothetical protein
MNEKLGLIICTNHQILLRPSHEEKNDMDGVCITNGEYKCVQRFGWEIGRTVHLCDLGVGGRRISYCILTFRRRDFLLNFSTPVFKM